MESILESMSNYNSTAKINSAIKSINFGDSFPVFGGIDFFNHHHYKSYGDEIDSSLNFKRSEVVNVNDMIDASLDFGESESSDEIGTIDNMIGSRFGLKDDINEIVQDYRKEFAALENYTIQDTEKHVSVEIFRRLQSESLKQLSPTEKATDDACKLLSKFTSSKKREDAEQALILIEEHSLGNFGHIVRGLVSFPDLLHRFLEVQKQNNLSISEDDLGSMISRCIEHSPFESYSLESLEYLFTFKGESSIEIKLLPGKYTIDNKLYELAKSHKICDSYYDASIDCVSFNYSHIDVVTKEKSGSYCGFRDAYHSLLYGGPNHLQALILRWDLWGDDCTADAAREFFQLSSDCPIQPLIARVSELSSKRDQ